MIKSPRILIIRSGAIGDTLMVTPLIRALRRQFPDAYLGMISSQTAFDVLRYNPHLNEVFPVTYRHFPIWLSYQKQQIVRHFRKLKLDIILSLEAHSDFTKLACQIGAKKILTYDENFQCDNLQYFPAVSNRHSVETHLLAGEICGVKSDGNYLECFYPSEIDDALRKRLINLGIDEKDLVVGIHAGWGSRQQHPTNTRLRSWSAERFAEVARWVYENYGAKIVLTGTKTDRPLNDFIIQASNVPCLNLAGQFSLVESAALIQRMSLYLTIDSGPAHLAAAIGTPVITLWGPGIITATAPLAGKGPVKILYSPPPCAPCYGTPQMKSCQDNICMKQITVEDVKTAIEQMLNENAG